MAYFLTKLRLQLLIVLIYYIHLINPSFITYIQRMFRLEGITAAVFTPFHENGDLNLEPIDAYIDCLVKDGVKNAFICGTNGEGWSLTLSERKQVAEHWKKVNNGRLGALVLSVSASAPRDSQELAAHAQSIGMDAIACTPPSGYRAKNFDDLINTLRVIAEKAPETPFYYYHLSVSHMHNIGDMEVFLVALESNPIPTFCGIKFSSPDLFEFKRCQQHPQGYQICSGCDPQLLGVVAVGGYEFIGGTVNFLGKLFNTVIEAYKKKDLETASTIYDQFVKNIRVLRKYGGGVPICKAIMKLSHMDLGPCRAPLHRLSPAEEEALRKDLEKAGYFASIK